MTDDLPPVVDVLERNSLRGQPKVRSTAGREQAELPESVGSVFDEPLVDDGEEVYRPALVRLVGQDMREILADLLEGFQSRREVLEWAQRLAVRSLGKVPHDVYDALGRAFVSRMDDPERPLLSVLLVPSRRDRDVDEEVAREARRRLAGEYLLPSAHRALRELRADAGEYLGDAVGSSHDPLEQRYIAMRPALDELDDRQQSALARFLIGFNDGEAVLEWGGRADLATHGEIGDGFASRCYAEESTRRALLGSRRVDERARESLAAGYILPAYNAGVRVLSGRAGEQPHETRQDRERTTA